MIAAAGRQPPGARAPAALRLGLLASLLAHGAVLAGLLAWQARQRPEAPPQTQVELMWDQPAEAGLESEVVASGEPPEPPAEVAPPPSPEAPPPVPPMAAVPAPPPTPPLPPAAPPVALPPGPAPVTLPPPPPAPILQAEAPPMAAPPDAPPPPPAPQLAEAPAQPPLAAVPPPPSPAPAPPQPARESQPSQAQPTRPAPRPRPAARPAGPPSEAPPAPASGGGVVAQGATSAPSLDPGFNNRPPTYPESARLMGQQGVVSVRITVGPDGRVRAVEILQSPGFSALEDAARRAALGLRFRPALRNGEPVQGQIVTSYQFRLN